MAKGYIYIMTNPALKDMFKIGFATDVENMPECKKLELDMSYYECPNYDNFHITLYTCKSSFFPTCGKKRAKTKQESLS